MQVGNLVWYRHFHKNGKALPQGKVVFKTNKHSTSYGEGRHKKVTVIGHLQRIRRNCVFQEEAIWISVCKLLELHTKGVGFTRRKVRAYLEMKVEREEGGTKYSPCCPLRCAPKSGCIYIEAASVCLFSLKGRGGVVVVVLSVCCCEISTFGFTFSQLERYSRQ